MVSLIDGTNQLRIFKGKNISYLNKTLWCDFHKFIYLTNKLWALWKDDKWPLKIPIAASLEPLNVTLYGKRDFTYVIKLKTLRSENYSQLSDKAWQVITRLFIRGKQEVKGGEDKLITKAEMGAMHFEERERQPNQRIHVVTRSYKKSKKWIFSSDPLEEISPAYTLIFA